MKKRMIGIGIAALLLLAPAAAPHVAASANSAPAYWSGSDAAGVVLREDCPIEVERETLTFRIHSLPETRYASAEEFDQYDASFTAEYVFSNPTNEDVTAQLAFPFGGTPEFLYDESTGADFDDLSRYHVRVAGAEVQPRIRYSYFRGYFTEEDISRLCDEKISKGFFSENTKITEHVYDVQYENTKNAILKITLSVNPVKTRLIFNDSLSSWEVEDGFLVLRFRLGDTAPSFFCLGEEPETVKTAVFSYEDRIFSSAETEISSEVHVHKNEALFSDWVEEMRPEAVGEIDWFNSVVNVYESEINDYGVVWMFSPDYFTGQLMRWFEYTLIVPAGGKVVNSVTAPLYPDITEWEYRYNYLLSPARLWADFGTLDVVIETEYEICDCPLSLTETEDGYRCTREGLPLGEFTFAIANGEPGEAPVFLWFLAAVLILHFAVALIALAVVLIVRAARKKK